MPRRIAIVGGGVLGLGAAWALHHHPDRFDFRLFEAQDRIGGNAITADMAQNDADYPFDDLKARRSFNYYGSILYGWGFRKARG